MPRFLDMVGNICDQLRTDTGHDTQAVEEFNQQARERNAFISQLMSRLKESEQSNGLFKAHKETILTRLQNDWFEEGRTPPPISELPALLRQSIFAIKVPRKPLTVLQRSGIPGIRIRGFFPGDKVSDAQGTHYTITAVTLNGLELTDLRDDRSYTVAFFEEDQALSPVDFDEEARALAIPAALSNRPFTLTVELDMLALELGEGLSSSLEDPSSPKQFTPRRRIEV